MNWQRITKRLFPTLSREPRSYRYNLRIFQSGRGNGKVDRKSLPEPDEARPELEKKYSSPRDPVEAQLTVIWEKVLRVYPIGIHDGFFDLGGHSLLAVRVVVEIEKAFQKKLKVATVFQYPTLAQLAA